MGRKKKYPNGKALKTACDHYFDSISYDEEVVKETPGGVRTIYNRLGEPVVRRTWVVAPTLTGLCNALGVSRDTWATYASDPDFSDACKGAKAVIEEYLEEQLSTREKSVQGLIFNLQNNYGWSGERREIEIGERAKAAADAANITMADKLALIGEVAEALGEKPGDGHDGSAEPDGTAVTDGGDDDAHEEPDGG